MISITDYKYVSIDAEWEGKNFITLQMGFSNEQGEIQQYVILVNDEYQLCPFNTYKGVSIECVHYPIGKKAALDYFPNLPKELLCMFYYSPRDIESFLGKEKWVELLLGSKVEKNRNLTIETFNHKGCTIAFKDIYGRFSSSLEKAYELLGLDTTEGKDIIHRLNINKSKMSNFIKEYPIEFYKYALGDITIHTLTLTLIEMMNEVLKDAFDLENVYNFENYPSSIGALVNDIMLRYLDKQYPNVLRTACLQSTTPEYKSRDKLINLKKAIDNGTSPYTISKVIQHDSKLLHGLGSCSIPAFYPGNYGGCNTSPFGAVVQGGRATNEEPGRNVFTNVVDIDLNSAYASALRKFDYPIGIPTLYAISTDPSEKKITLKQFLSKYEDELIPGLYTIYVSGMLNHKQDLVYSKHRLSSSAIATRIYGSTYAEDTDVDSHIGGDFLLTTKQIENGIITHRVLQVLRKVCSNKEYASWLNLEVKLAIYYPKTKELTNEDWVSTLSQEESRGYKLAFEDTRSRVWTRIPLEKFVGHLVDKRKEYKRKRYESTKYESLQNMLKLIVNTLYGNFASPYYPIGNTVIANNITANARVGSWMMAKALGCKQVITDGGFYELEKVPHMRTYNKTFRRPSLYSHYEQEGKWQEYVDYKPLMLMEDLIQLLNTSKDEAQNILDTKASKHIKEFWSHYELDLGFDLEHKLEHTGHTAITNPYGKVDYMIMTYEGKEVIKVRGVRPDDYDIHPKVELLRAIRDGRKAIINATVLTELVGVNDYIKCPERFGDNLPGYTVQVNYIFKPKTYASLLFETASEYYKREKAYKERVRYYNDKYKDLDISLYPLFLKD